MSSMVALKCTEVKVFMMASPVAMIIFGVICTALHCDHCDWTMTTGSVLLAIGIVLLMVIFFGFLGLSHLSNRQWLSLIVTYSCFLYFLIILQ